MSKAFTRESDDGPDLPTVSRPVSSLPPGTKNYITPDGAKKLREELERLEADRRATAALEDKNDSKRLLQTIDQRSRQLEESLRSAEIVEIPEPPWDQVRFGATIRVRDNTGEETRYRIVGVDETDMDRDWVSWLSPIARALVNRRVGEKVKIRVPAGERVLEILEIGYESIS